MVKHTTEEKENIEVPETDQKLVMDRFEEVRKKPERILDWDEVKEALKS